MSGAGPSWGALLGGALAAVGASAAVAVARAMPRSNPDPRRHRPGAVFVYRNLHTGTWSVRALEGERRGRVIAHPDAVTVEGAELRVNAAGRERVRAECVKGVHAGVVGVVAPGGIPASWPRELVAEVGYNPFLFDSFVLLANNAPLERAAYVELPPQPRGGARPLLAALLPRDRWLLELPKSPVDPARLDAMRRCRERLAARKGQGR